MSLYRKYRPQKFEDLIGQDHVAQTLARALEQGKLGHSYLFSGPRGTGKTTVARILARAANCEEKKGQPCGKCQSCKTIEKNQSVDILEIDAASNRGIDEIRELRDKVRFTPSFGKYKVYIIDEVHMLTKEAFNALLKTLEEPPAHAIFILATTEAHKVPTTIVSRCQRFDFRRASLKNVLELLEKISKSEKAKAEPAALALIARAADGAYRDALTLLEQMVEESSQILTVDIVRDKLGLIAEPLQWQLIHQITSGDKELSIKTYNKLTEGGVDIKHLTVGLLGKLRQLLFYAIAPEVLESDITDEEVRQLKKLSQQVSQGDVVRLINLVLRAEGELRHTSMPELALAAAIVEYLNRSSKHQETNNKQIPNSKFQNDKEKSDVIPTKAEGSLSGKEQKDFSHPSGLGEKPETVPPRAGGKTNPKKSSVTTHHPSPSPGLRTASQPLATGHRQDVAINYDNIEPVEEEKWQAVVSKVKKINSPLAGILKQSKPYLSQKKLIIEVPYPFWEERIKSKTNAQAICATACEELGREIECAIPKSNGDLRKKINEQVKKESTKTKTEIEEVFGKS